MKSKIELMAPPGGQSGWPFPTKPERKKLDQSDGREFRRKPAAWPATAIPSRYDRELIFFSFLSFAFCCCWCWCWCCCCCCCWTLDLFMEMCGNETIAPSVSRPSPQTFHGLSCFMSRRSFLFFSFFFFTEFYRVFFFFFRLLRRITSNHDFCGRRFDFFSSTFLWLLLLLVSSPFSFSFHRFIFLGMWTDGGRWIGR